jgi:hypothetical protein
VIIEFVLHLSTQKNAAGDLAHPGTGDAPEAGGIELRDKDSNCGRRRGKTARIPQPVNDRALSKQICVGLHAAYFCF